MPDCDPLQHERAWKQLLESEGWAQFVQAALELRSDLEQRLFKACQPPVLPEEVAVLSGQRDLIQTMLDVPRQRLAELASATVSGGPYGITTG